MESTVERTCDIPYPPVPRALEPHRKSHQCKARTDKAALKLNVQTLLFMSLFINAVILHDSYIQSLTITTTKPTCFITSLSLPQSRTHAPLPLRRRRQQRALPPKITITLHIRRLLRAPRAITPLPAPHITHPRHGKPRSVVVQRERHGFVVPVGDVRVACHADGAGLAGLPGVGVEGDFVLGRVADFDVDGCAGGR